MYQNLLKIYNKTKKEKWCHQLRILRIDIFLKNIEKEIHVPG